jgi:hypothetical protein
VPRRNKKPIRQNETCQHREHDGAEPGVAQNY